MNTETSVEAYKYSEWDLAHDVATIYKAKYWRQEIKLTQVFKVGDKPLLDLREWNGGEPGAGFTLDTEAAENLYNALEGFLGKGANK